MSEADGPEIKVLNVRKPRVWIGAAIALLMWIIIKVPQQLAQGTMLQFMGMFYGPFIGALAMLIWWLAASKLPWQTRCVGAAAFLGGAVITCVLGHRSLWPMGVVVLAMPVAVTAWALSAFIASRIGPRMMRTGVAVIVLIAWLSFTLVRFDGLTGDIGFKMSFRWSKTPEERYLASLAGRRVTAPPATAPVTLSPGDWPAFRGALRDGRLAGVSVRTDWSVRPPKQIWKHLIGPGWSSMCAVGDRIFTQEQRGDAEVVVCYSASTGDEAWSHADPTRFTESMAGPGPRATPTFDQGRLYTTGANGTLNCLDARTGAVVWSRDITADTGARVPMWGFSSSPLVSGGLVYIIDGAPGKSMAAYNAATGTLVWAAGEGWSYASPQLAKIDGVEQLLLVTEKGLTGLDPAAGRTLWSHAFALPVNANRAVQPAVIGDNDILLGAAFAVGTRRIKITHEGADWKTQTIWNSRGLNPYYNDMVVHQGHIYGFDNSTFVCVDAATGARNWRVHEYGNGQVLLLADQGLLLILSEQGEVALVDAKPDSHHEISRFQAIEGKTWNHPVIAHGKLFVRNGEEIACYGLE